MSFDPERDLQAQPIQSAETRNFLDDLQLPVRKPYGGRLVSSATRLLEVIAKNIEHHGYYGVESFDLDDNIWRSMQSAFLGVAVSIPSLQRAVGGFAEPRLEEALRRHGHAPANPSIAPSAPKR